VEDDDAYVFLIAKPDSTEPYLVFWSPQLTNDVNLNEDISLNMVVNWQASLPENYKVDTTLAQTFAESTLPGQSFTAATIMECGLTVLTAIKRSPAFIRLIPCSACVNITDPGSIVGPATNSGISPFDPEQIANNLEASGGSGGNLEYQWQQSTDNLHFVDIPGATALDYNPPSLTETTYFRRAAKRSTCTGFEFTHSVAVTVFSNACPSIVSFKRIPHNMAVCNPTGDYFYEIMLNQVVTNQIVSLTELPINGLHIPLCMLNGVALNPSTFFAIMHYVDDSSLDWHVRASDGNIQTLRLYYCWTNNYPEPVEFTSASSLCSGQTLPCVEGFNVTDPEIGERSEAYSSHTLESFRFSVAPNPGMDHLLLTYSGKVMAQATLRIVTPTGQCISTRNISDLEDQQQLEIDTSDFPAGIYFLSLQTGLEVKWVIWERI